MPTLDQLRKLLAAEPGDSFLLYGMAQELARLNRGSESLAYFDKCLAADPEYLYAYYHKARVLAELGQTEAARSTLTQGLARAAADLRAASEMRSLLDSLE
ncbi:MAG: tetratricopeptide repeat protein [Phycisphaerales bacterium]|nr:tetratricopeptide repeat protein [Phycisphaerales bacterium]